MIVAPKFLPLYLLPLLFLAGCNMFHNAHIAYSQRMIPCPADEIRVGLEDENSWYATCGPKWTNDVVTAIAVRGTYYSCTTETTMLWPGSDKTSVWCSPGLFDGRTQCSSPITFQPQIQWCARWSALPGLGETPVNELRVAEEEGVRLKTGKGESESVPPPPTR